MTRLSRRVNRIVNFQFTSSLNLSFPDTDIQRNDNSQLPIGNLPTNPNPRQPNPDSTLTLLLPLLILISTLLSLLLLFALFLVVIKRRRGTIALRDDDGPADLSREDEIMDADGGFEGVEERWLDGVSPQERQGYMRAKVYQSQYPPNSQPTDITLSQFLTIQEKGVSAWSFEPDYESNLPIFVQSRTEITFLEGGDFPCCVQSNLPLPRLNDVYYWECKLYEIGENVNVSLGLATKPFPSFRLPGTCRYSIAYNSNDGFKCHSYPFFSSSYGPPLTDGDVLGIAYRPRSGIVFFTRNGKRLEDAYIGLNKSPHTINLFPTVGSDGPAKVEVNLGQNGFVFIEANVKKWGLAPSIGTLGPPPAYGSERGSVLLQTGNASTSTAIPGVGTDRRSRRVARVTSVNGSSRHRHTESMPNLSTAPPVNGHQPVRPSPLRTSSVARSSSPSPPNSQASQASSSANGRNSILSSASFDGDEDGEELEMDDHDSLSQQNQASTSAIPIEPPEYRIIDPYRYAEGVAESILEEIFHSHGGIPMGRDPQRENLLQGFREQGVMGPESPGTYEGRSFTRGRSGDDRERRGTNEGDGWGERLWSAIGRRRDDQTGGEQGQNQNRSQNPRQGQVEDQSRP